MSLTDLIKISSWQPGNGHIPVADRNRIKVIELSEQARGCLPDSRELEAVSERALVRIAIALAAAGKQKEKAALPSRLFR